MKRVDDNVVMPLNIIHYFVLLPLVFKPNNNGSNY